jgi:hypothetical protein
VGQPANTGQVISGSTYRSGAGLPGFVAGAVNDLNSGASGRAAMQAAWLNRLANQMGASGDNAYLWAEVLRGAGGINSGPGNTTTGGGGGISFGAGITPGGVAREQANLLAQQAQDVALRHWAGQNAVSNWDVIKRQDELKDLESQGRSGGLMMPGYGEKIIAKQQELDLAREHIANLVSLSNRGVTSPNIMNLMNRVTQSPNAVAGSYDRMGNFTPDRVTQSPYAVAGSYDRMGNFTPESGTSWY